MWSISLPPSSQQHYFSEHVIQLASLALKYKYVTVLIILLAAVAVFIFVQNSVASTPAVQSAATHKTHVEVEEKAESQPTAVQPASTPTQASISSSGTNAEVKVNNQPIPVPQNGTVQKQIVTDGGTTKVNISVNSNTNGSSQSSSSTSFQLNTSTETESIVENSE